MQVVGDEMDHKIIGTVTIEKHKTKYTMAGCDNLVKGSYKHTKNYYLNLWGRLHYWIGLLFQDHLPFLSRVR